MVTNRARWEIIWIAPKKNPKVAQTTGTVDVFDPPSSISGPTSRRASACPNLHEWWTQPRSCGMPSCSAIDLAEMGRSFKITSWIWSVISGVVTVLGCRGRGASQVKKSPRLNWATQFLTVVCDGAYSPNIFFQNGVNFLRRLSLQEKKNLMTARISILLKSRAPPGMLSFSLCNKKRLAVRHMNRTLFPMTLSIPSYDIGK